MTFATNNELYAGLDLRSREERRRADNEAAAADPQCGDYWHECFQPVALVIARVGGQVATFEHYKDEPRGRYSYDTSKVTWTPVEEFKRRFRYGSIDGFWAHVDRSGCRTEVIEQWRAEGGVL